MNLLKDDSKNWTFFRYVPKKCNLFCLMWLKEFVFNSKHWTFFFFFQKNWLQDLNPSCSYDSKNWTFFNKRLQELNCSFEKDPNNWTVFSVTQNKTSEIAKKPSYHKLLWTGETDADDKTGVYVMMLNFYKNWWFDWKFAGAAAAIAIVIESPYKHQRLPRRGTCTRRSKSSSQSARSPGPMRTSSEIRMPLNRRDTTLESSRMKWPESSCTLKTRSKAETTITSSQMRGPPGSTGKLRVRTSQSTRRMHHDGTAAFESALTYHLNDGDIREGVSLHRASSNDNKYADESGDTGVWIFERLMISLFELLGMVGWQNAHFNEQKQKRTKNTFFGPFSSSVKPQRSISARWHPMTSLARTLRKACTKISTTASTKRQYTWKHGKAGRSQPCSVLRKSRRSWKEKSRQRQESQRITSNSWSEGKSSRTAHRWKLMVCQKERQSKWRQSFWEEWNTKVSAPNQWIRKEKKKEKNQNRALMWAVSKMKIMR